MDGGWVVAGPREFGVEFWSYQCHHPLGVNGWGIMFDGMLVCLDRGGNGLIEQIRSKLAPRVPNILSQMRSGKCVAFQFHLFLKSVKFEIIVWWDTKSCSISAIGLVVQW
jgi:hypothetical protein